jgi:hypothetical protein
MKGSYVLAVLVSLILISGIISRPAAADESHARIVRLSLVQGDVRFTPHYHADSLTDSKAGWELAPLNLPIRQSYALATDGSSRAEIEFENGAMAFLAPNTVVEFYDLSLYDGALITRLVLRQGSGIFYVHPARGDYFSVTGGDFSVEADGRARFRLDNFDDGSNLNVELGQVNVLRKDETKLLTKGQSYSLNVNEGNHAVIGRTPDSDDFDKWVSGRIDSVATATAYANQYVNSPDYTSGFADLYNYGSFYNLPGYGYGWQPFGVGVGWCPFNNGNWYFDSFGWNFIGAAPWGWLPYHYGGWVFSPAYGWVWVPSGFGFGGRLPYRPVTGVWVHNGATTGLVPLHPADGHGKTPLNLGRGVYALNGRAVGSTMVSSVGTKWSTERNLPRNALAASTFAGTSAPTRVSRTILSSPAGGRPVTVSRDSSIVYDASQHRFVNGNGSAKMNSEEVVAKGNGNGTKSTKANGDGNRTATLGNPPAHSAGVPPASRGSVPARPNITPPHPTSSYGGSAHASGGGSASWGGGNHNSGATSSSGSSRGTSAGASAGSAASHPSGGSRH